MIAANLPALQVVVPLLAAPAAMLLRGRGWAWAFATLISWAALLMACVLLAHVMRTGQPIHYEMGGWAPPWGIEYVIDAVNAFVLVIVAAIGAVVMPFARLSVLKEFGAEREYLFYTSYLLCLAGLLGVTITGDAFNLFVFLEISSLSSYVLVSMGQDRRALTAAYQYLVLGTIGATFIVIGIAFLYETTGTLNIADLANRVHAVGTERTVRVAFAFLTVGICLKLALFPLHLWLPNAYTFAPSMVTAFLAATATKVGVYILLRFFFTIFGPHYSFEVMPLADILIVLAIIAMFVGSTVAIFQTNIKRMLAYSSVAQIGYMVLGIGMASVTGLMAAILHLFNHALMKGGLFMVLGCVAYRLGSVHIESFAGLGRRMPWTMAAFVVGGLSLIGVPLTVGFVSKWYLVLAALEKGWWPVAVLIVVSSLLAIVYVWRVIESAYFRSSEDPEAGPREVAEAPLSMLIPAWVLIAANVWFGVDPGITTDVARQAATSLFGGAP